MHFRTLEISLLSLILIVESEVKSVKNVTYEQKEQFSSADIDTELYPNQAAILRQCKRTDMMPGVCDPRQLLSANEVNAIQEVLNNTCDVTPCPCEECQSPCFGYGIQVLILPSLSSAILETYRSIGDMTLAEWISRIRKKWQFGQCENNVVLIFSLNDYKVSISLGNVIRSRLTEKCLKKALRQAQDGFQRENHASSIKLIIKKFRAALLGRLRCHKRWSSHIPMTTGALIAIVFSCVCTPVIGCVFCTFMCPWFRNVGGGKSNKYLKSVTYQREEAYATTSDKASMDSIQLKAEDA